MTVHWTLVRMKVYVWMELGATTVFALQDSTEKIANKTLTNVRI